MMGYSLCSERVGFRSEGERFPELPEQASMIYIPCVPRTEGWSLPKEETHGHIFRKLPRVEGTSHTGTSSSMDCLAILKNLRYTAPVINVKVSPLLASAVIFEVEL
jgi:hypothetical protein